MIIVYCQICYKWYNHDEVSSLKKFFRNILVILLVIVCAAVAGLAWLCVNEYKPDDVTELKIQGKADEGKELREGDTLSVLTWNAGYAGLGKNSDFFMDGGENVAAADQATVYKYLGGISDTVYGKKENIPSIRMFQEVDENSTRTYGIDETKVLGKGNYTYALNFCSTYVPYPLPPIGRVNSGILTSTEYKIASAERISLPCPFKWPVSVVNLKRCLLVSRIPVADSSKELVVVNMHLEAYDDGEGKIAQTNQLLDFMQSEYKKGNYVIAGGDFNQTFPGALEKYPNTHPELWLPGEIDADMLSDGWQFAYDNSTPTCRLLNQPYDPADTENTQYYVIDGFILSPNVKLNSTQSLDCGFENSDHNPVEINITLS